MARKTIEVAKVKDMANRTLRNSVDEYREQRLAIAWLLESILMETGNYKGFTYLRSEYLPAAEQTDSRVLRDGYDDSRRHYY